ncbi:MmgE/PrpD family protein [Escherichia coli]|uniref:MmgE/PrpD family protein n=1 Tax=Escherichia coli TaxID=562 RepID=UPI00044646D2|nr:MmgE/PrpD family protein [Escherichia coli]EZJ47585.1 mmgE/PrpD family protein [Escherichia coli 1-182-04_S4_C2]EZJ75517.1 mmgE/PrpD family protein [Escherichia coli 1-182-04_S3_C3]KDA64708.1 mmgE/PrpD family protein [Escherichia coli 2-052-05_S1_C1]KDW38199.1 mmgE/PrpD family protein [Escherichia coli 2-177-06_S1_C2]
MTYSEKLSQFIYSNHFDAIPPHVISRAKIHLLDSLGVALAGTVQNNAINGRNGLHKMPNTQGKCRVWGSSYTFSPAYAALANGIAAHVLDFDDTHTDSITHGSAVLVPLVIALTEDLNLNSREMLAAYVTGWEIAARVGLTAKGTFHKRGFHSTAIAGIFGAVSGAASLLNLSPIACAHALGLAGSQASGIAEYLTNSSSAKCFHAGWAAHSGILSAYLAEAGMTGPLSVFEGRFGLFATHGIQSEINAADVCRELGEHWEIMRVSVKPYPCCHFAHATVDCARMLIRDGIKPEEVKHILCVVDPIASALICEPIDDKFSPQTPYAAKFSLPYLVASGMIDDGLSLESFSPEQLNRTDVLELARKVSYRYSEEGEIPFPAYFPGLISVTLKDGREMTKRLNVNYGNPENPMKNSDVEQKFRNNVRGILPPQATEKVIQLVADIENHPVTELTQWLTNTVNSR